GRLPGRKRDLLEVMLHQFEQFAGQSGEQQIVRMAQARTVAKMGSSLPSKGNRRRAAVWPATIPDFPCPRARLSSEVVWSLKSASVKNLGERIERRGSNRHDFASHQCAAYT